jgi:hypothetical protein
MLQLCFSSQAVRPLEARELTLLLRKARAGNEAIGITGLLLYDNQTFLQILEGYPRVVENVFKKIQPDPPAECRQPAGSGADAGHDACRG